jgi:hypothetical protein
MWPFATRGSRFLGDAAARHPSRLSAAHFARNDAVIKLWLPEKLLAAVDVLCAEHEASRPDVLRWILFEHVHGRTEFAHLRRRAREAAEMSVRFCRRPAPPGEAPARDLATARAVQQHFLGKATEAVKLTLPAALKQELENLAERFGQPLSDYLRGVLARQLLGEVFHHGWQQELARVNGQAPAHEAP